MYGGEEGEESDSDKERGESGIEVVCCARRLDGKEFSVWLVEGEGKRLRYWGKVVCEELDGKVVGARWE